MAEPDDVCITLDLDWAPDPILRQALALVTELDVPATLFCTHPTAVLDGIDRGRFELAWHPNFLAGRSEDEVLDEQARWFPGAVGVRSHALYFHSRLAPMYLSRGIRYLGHDLRFAEPDLAPSHHWSSLVNLPGYWEDDVHALFFGGVFDVDLLDLARPGMKVFDFHPIHLALNTDRMERYEAAREDLDAGRPLDPHVNPGRGAQTFLREVVRQMKGQPGRFRFRTMAQVAGHHEREHPFQGRFTAAD